MSALLSVEHLCVDFPSGGSVLHAVDDVSFDVSAGEVVGVVGESGSGKSVTGLAVLGLVDEPGQVRAEALRFAGRDLQRLPPNEHRALLGGEIAMIFQDPTSSLNPSFTIAFQLMEAIALHQGGTRAERRARALELLRAVEIADAERRLDAYPHQLSGGMSQRVMLAMAIACNPRLLIADEPTTALDVTVQAQMLALLKTMQEARGMAMLLVTHDLGVVAETADRVLVMYAGQIVERASTDEIFARPRHPYTEALLASLPERNAGRRRLASLPGVVPGALDRPRGCLLAPRCPYVQPRCTAERPPLFELSGAAAVRCFFPLPDHAEMSPPR